jgi:hypothetical protein
MTSDEPTPRYRLEHGGEQLLATDRFLELARAFAHAVREHGRAHVKAFDGNRPITPGPPRLVERFPL